MTPATLQLRKQVESLTSDLTTDLTRFWRGIEVPKTLEVALMDTLPDLVDTYGTAASAYTADWYDNLREDHGAPGRFTAIPADLGDAGTQALVGWAAAESLDLPSFKSLILGGAQRRIANFARLTVTDSSVADPGARGWRRTGLGRCAFCRMLLGRGAVYSEASVAFEAHDHCQCGAEPAFV